MNNIFFSEFGAQIVNVWDYDSGITFKVAGSSSTAGYSGDGGNATAALLNQPASLALDAAGNLFIADSNNNVIRKVSSVTPYSIDQITGDIVFSDGKISTLAGNGTAGFFGNGGQATSAQLNIPTGVSVGVSGNVFIADSQNHVIRMVNSSGIITTVAGMAATPGYTGDGGDPLLASLNGPKGVWVDGSGKYFIADSGNNVVRRVV